MATIEEWKASLLPLIETIAQNNEESPETKAAIQAINDKIDVNTANDAAAIAAFQEVIGDIVQKLKTGDTQGALSAAVGAQTELPTPDTTSGPDQAPTDQQE